MMSKRVEERQKKEITLMAVLMIAVHQMGGLHSSTRHAEMSTRHFLVMSLEHVGSLKEHNDRNDNERY